MNKELRLEIVTPTRTFYKQNIKRLTFRATTGEMTILKNHAPIMTIADIGIMTIVEPDDTEKKATLFGGSVLVENNKILIVTDDALWPDEIDVHRAEEAKKRAEDKLNTGSNQQEFLHAELQLKKALVRIDLANTYDSIARHRRY